MNAGIRWDFETNANNNDYVTPPAIAAALRGLSGLGGARNRSRGLYFGRRQPKAVLGRLPAPAGVAYDVYGDRDLVFFGGAGRYYDRQLSSRA